MVQYADLTKEVARFIPQIDARDVKGLSYLCLPLRAEKESNDRIIYLL